MLYRKGADPEALDRVARELTACADEVEVIRANGARALAVLGRSWGGPDADAAQDGWRSTSTALSSLGSTLDRMAARLGDNSRAQRSASGGGAGGLLAPGPLFPFGFGGSAATGSEAPPVGPPFADGLRGTRPQEIDLELAELAKGVYDGEGTDNFDALDDSELVALGIDPRRLTGPGGFAANVYRDAAGDYVLAFAGTDPTSVSDWATNAQQGMGGLSAQHLQAVALARHLASAVGSENMVLTGHSLGGGLASTASVATDVPAVTFNAAGVHPATVLAAVALGHHDAGLSAGQIRNYHVRGEILTTVQNPLGSFTDHVPFIGDDPLPNALGTQIALDPAKGPDLHLSPWALVSPVISIADTAKDLGGYAVGLHDAPSVIDAMEASDYFGRH